MLSSLRNPRRMTLTPSSPPPVNPAPKKRLRLSLQAAAVKMSVVETRPRSMMPMMALHQCLVHPCNQVIASRQKKRKSRRA